MSERIRITHVIGNLETGGAQMLMIELMRRLDRTRFDPRIIFFKEPNHFAAEIEAREWDVRESRVTRSYRLREMLRLSRAIAATQPDIVHTHADFANFAGRAAAIHAGAPRIVVHYQNTYEHRFTPEFVAMEAQLARRTDAYIACSGGVRDFMAERLALDSDVHLFPNAVDLDPYIQAARDRAAAREKLGVPPNVFHLVHTARMEPHKQPQQLLHALALSMRESASSLGNWRVSFLGGGSLHGTLIKLVAKIDAENAALGIEPMSPRVHFAGWTKEIPAWLASADVFCLVSKNEGLPLSLVEAMAARTATVSPNIIGPQEVIGANEYGLLVDSDNPRSILEALLRYRRDDAFRGAIVEKAAARANDFCIDKYTTQLEEFYTSQVATPGITKASAFTKLATLVRLNRTARLQRRRQHRAAETA